MRIFLIRHGDASGGLTTLGQGQISRTADFLKSLGLDLSKTALLTSQLQRAVESAEIVRTTLGLVETVPQSWLTWETTENTKACLAQFVADHTDLDAVIGVSHMPEMKQLLKTLGF